MDIFRWWYGCPNEAPPDGAFGKNFAYGVRDFRDGLSNTFFVGESGLLVHDITYVTHRRATTAIVPGFTPGGPRADANPPSTRPVSLVRQIHSGLRP